MQICNLCTCIGRGPRHRACCAVMVMVHAPLPPLHLAGRLSNADLVGRPRGGASSEARRHFRAILGVVRLRAAVISPGCPQRVGAPYHL
jgi:hypothetical protein